MDNHYLVRGVIFSIVVVIGLGLFFYNMVSYKRFMSLTLIGKIVSASLTIVSVMMIVVGGSFAFDNFTYTPPPKDDVMLELEEVVVTSNFTDEDYTQTITQEEYDHLGVDALLDLYTSKGQADIRSISQNSLFTTKLMLQNIGIDLKEEDNTLTKDFHLLSGKEVDLLDGQERMLVFVDDSTFSANQIDLLRRYNMENSNQPLDFILIFPTLSGTEVAKFFSGNRSGAVEDYQIVSNDSMRVTDDFSLLDLTQKEYKINNLPAYILIDDKSVISNAGVGTIFDSTETLRTFLRRSTTDGNKLYLQIRKSRDIGIQKAKERVEDVVELVEEAEESTDEGE